MDIWSKYSLFDMTSAEWIELTNDLTRHIGHIEEEPAVLDFFIAHLKKRKEVHSKLTEYYKCKQDAIDDLMGKVASDNIAQSLKVLIKCYEILDLIREADKFRKKELNNTIEIEQQKNKKQVEQKESNHESEDLHNTPTTNSMV